MKKLGVLFFAIVLIGCGNKEKKTYKPVSLGAINTLAVVMENDLWRGEAGDKIRAYYAAPVLGLTWDEPLFNLEQIPPAVFDGTTRHRRAILYVMLDTVSGSQLQDDVYAAPQKVGVIKGQSEAELIENIDKSAAQIIAGIKQMEIEESQQRFLRSLSQEGVLEDKFGVSLRLPSLYKVGKQEDNFVWIDREIQKGSMNLIAYEMPWNTFDNDSTLVSDIIQMRDSIGKKYIPGPDMPDKITYMGTEKAFAPYVSRSEIAGKPAIEVRGIWDVVNYPMAGPFITYIIFDDDNQRLMVVEGFTFAPATNKRDNMFELEALIKTLKFNNSTATTP